MWFKFCLAESKLTISSYLMAKYQPDWAQEQQGHCPENDIARKPHCTTLPWQSEIWSVFKTLSSQCSTVPFIVVNICVIQLDLTAVASMRNFQRKQLPVFPTLSNARWCDTGLGVTEGMRNVWWEEKRWSVQQLESRAATEWGMRDLYWLRGVYHYTPPQEPNIWAK